MISSFQPLNTITSGLVLQQLQEDVIANNLSQTSLDSQGYLMNSLQQVNSVNNPSISFTGLNGPLSIGTGSSAESITRLRSSFLDSQIQQQSTTVGYNEILSNFNSTGVMDQINSIVNGTTTLNSAFSSFAAKWATLSAAPTNTGDQTAVVNAGVTFASTANSEYAQLQNLQLGMNTQVSQTISQINGLVQQLGSINQQLMTTTGSNQNSLLDARDYALDKLSRLVNYQSNYGSNGTVNVWLNDVALVNGTNVSALQANISNPNNPQLLDVTVQNDGGTFSSETPGGVTTPIDISSLITGGNLGGELYARNVLLQSYKGQIDQVATSVLNMTNNIYEAGYVANSTTTGTAFFTGTGAADMAVNAVLTGASSLSPFLATEVSANTATGQLAGFLGNMGTLLANNYVQSSQAINAAGKTVDPTATIASQILAGNFATNPTPNAEPPATFQFTINGVKINYTTADSIDSLLSTINTQMGGTVDAVFNKTTQQIYMFSNGNITVQESGTDNFTNWGKIRNVLVSSIRMNNGFATTYNTIVNGGVDSSFNSTLSPAFGQGPNSQAFFITPSSTGTFTLNGVQIAWNNKFSLTGAAPSIKQSINTALGGAVTVSWVTSSQYLELQSTAPMSLYDNSGNFTVFTGLDGNVSLNNMSSNVLSTASTQDSSLQTAYTSSSASLTQLNVAQDNLAGVSGTFTVDGVAHTAGVPVAQIQEQAQQSLITYNAMLQVMEVINQMLDALVGISDTSNSSGIFAQKS